VTVPVETVVAVGVGVGVGLVVVVDVDPPPPVSPTLRPLLPISEAASVTELLQALKRHMVPARTNGAMVNALLLRLRASELVTISYPQILMARGNPPRARLHGLLFARGVLRKGNRHLSLNESFVEAAFTSFSGGSTYRGGCWRTPRRSGRKAAERPRAVFSDGGGLNCLR
jgi:hypothetical protein